MIVDYNVAPPAIVAYHGTASPSQSQPGRQYMGVPTIDITDPNNPITTAHLVSTLMLDPWESLKVNERRALLAADNGQNGGGGPEIDVYDRRMIAARHADRCACRSANLQITE